MKHEWRKHEKELYGAKQSPRLVNLPKQQFIMINGKGDPNQKEFSDKVSALFSLAYAIKMRYKKAPTLEDINYYTVYPLEAVWKTVDDNKILDKNHLEYIAMIRQPNFITENMFLTALEHTSRKKPNALYEQIYFETIPAENCVEILHIGAYDDEPISFQKMDLFAKETNVKRSKNYHREIYLNNENRVSKDKLKTILCYPIE